MWYIYIARAEVNKFVQLVDPRDSNILYDEIM